MLAPQQQPQQQPNQAPVNMSPTQETNPIMPDGQPNQPTNTIKPNFISEEGADATGPSDEEIQAHLDNLPDEAKAFLAEHLTPEFVTAISLISGEKVGQYLMKYADQDKVLVPVPRKVAEENLAAMKSQASGGQPQQAASQAMPAPAPQGGMMAPMQQTATPQ